MTLFRLPKAALVAAAFAVALVPHAMAQTLNLRISTESPVGSNNHFFMESFISELEARLGDGVNIDFHHSGSLGSEQVHLDMVRGGQIQLYSIGADAMALDEKTAFFEMPFLFGDRAQVVRILDDPEIRSELFASFREKTGVQPLSLGTFGFRQFSSSSGPIVVPEDLNGMKMRVPGSAQRMQTWEFLGASPLTISSGELYVALANRTADGQEQSVSSMNARSLQEVQSHLSISNYLYGPQMLVMHGGAYDRLTDEQRTAVEEAAMVASQAIRDKEEQDEAALLEAFSAELEINDIDREAFVEFVQPLWTSIVETSSEREFLQKVVDMALEQ